MLNGIKVGGAIQKAREDKKTFAGGCKRSCRNRRTHLSAIERGERKPTLETFFKIADAMSMKPSELMTKIENEICK
ncbi:MAG: helix-turn-helix transcriptional regulator [Clostridia bacterium]|nr:helix-turn-helix transcriptional regulator [Clostridia bacterium]